MTARGEEMKKFDYLNLFAQKRGTVLLGSDFAREIPFSDLKDAFGIGNFTARCFKGLTLKEAKGVLRSVTDLHPKKVIIMLGEEDMKLGRGIEGILKDYGELIDEIKAKGAKVVAASVCDTGESVRALNLGIERTAREKGAIYADVTSAAESETPLTEAFMKLRLFIGNSFCDAMTLRFA